ncbi:hypothetical protein [Paracoccus sp. (in: a-proteobacteria)]|uniref:hypothetical protein n=1 Tax=Paracoccus sp. TaxID=267 RepID=UPI0026E0D204|nr:hypothetical protein [Paracoccus sp. (in: a-proteobacteria)]MDO5648332.1 hypothetical protein [Paracoccus sp. (in: a-proteobacteria)]
MMGIGLWMLALCALGLTVLLILRWANQHRRRRRREGWDRMCPHDPYPENNGTDNGNWFDRLIDAEGDADGGGGGD